MGKLFPDKKEEITTKREQRKKMSENIFTRFSTDYNNNSKEFLFSLSSHVTEINNEKAHEKQIRQEYENYFFHLHFSPFLVYFYVNLCSRYFCSFQKESS